MSKIMLADDISSIRLSLVKILESKGHRVYSYASGEEVLENFALVKPDIVLLDVEMEGLSGLETCVELRKRDDSFNIPIAIISAKDKEDDIVNGLTSGADEYILKPIRKSEVLSKITLLIGKRKANIGEDIAPNVLFAGKYKIIKLLGEGGFSSVYLADDKQLNRRIALKILDAKKLDKKCVSQFLREAYGLSLLNHENIMKLLEFGNFHDKYYIATEFIDGESLWDIIERKSISERYASFVGLEILKALQCMEEHHIIHRDIKPENIMITPSGRVVLVDFGLAKDNKQHTLSNVDEMQGTPHFMSPEYIKDEKLSIQCDIYSLGVSLFNAVSNDYPFNGSSMSILQDHVNKRPPELHKLYSHISKKFSKMIGKMLVKNPKKRISIFALYEILDNLVQRTPTGTIIRTDDDNDIPKETTSIEHASLRYHLYPTPGKISMSSSKSLKAQKDLSMAYIPGVIVPCMSIKKNPKNIWKYTARNNIIALISDGSDVSELGNIGPYASMPMLEGKASILKTFADIDAIPIALDKVFINNETSVTAISETIERLEPAFGGFNIGNITYATSIELEKRLNSNLSVPVFNDDLHSIAIVTFAGIINSLKIVNKNLEESKIVINGHNNIELSLANFYVSAGVKKENLLLCDEQGVIYNGRTENMSTMKEQYATNRGERTLTEAMKNADIFIDFARENIVSTDMINSMAKDGCIFALGNQTFNTLVDIAINSKIKIFASNRGGLPNQISDILVSPGILRGALDVRAKIINRAMKMAVVEALIELMAEEIPSDIYDVLEYIYPEDIENGIFDGAIPLKDKYILPRVFDNRLVPRIAKKVAKAATLTGVAQVNINDFDDYEFELMLKIHH